MYLICSFDPKILANYIFLETDLIFSMESLRKSLYDSLNLKDSESKIGVEIES